MLSDCMAAGLSLQKSQQCLDVVCAVRFLKVTGMFALTRAIKREVEDKARLELTSAPEEQVMFAALW